MHYDFDILKYMMYIMSTSKYIMWIRDTVYTQIQKTSAICEK